ncbi:MAG: TetR/AcrR family transcriptional regulator [Jatrophihabitantaceae bacterium]
MAIFSRAFAGQPDLVELSPAARRVLAGSAALFFERGAADTSVRDLTRACGLSPGALYNHFPSKDELLFTLVRHGHERMLRRIGAAVEPVADRPTEAYAAFVHGYVLGHVEQPELAQVVRREYLHLSPQRYQQIVEVRRSVRRLLTRLVQAGADAGEFSLIGDPVATSLMVLDMCSRTSDWFHRAGESDASGIAQRYVEAAMRLAGVS